MRQNTIIMAAKKNSSSSISYSDLVAQIKNKQFAPVYLLHGEEPFFIDRLCKMFEEGILEPEERDFNQVVLYGKDTEVDMRVIGFLCGKPKSANYSCRLLQIW